MSRDQIKDWCDEVMRRVADLTSDYRLAQAPYYEYGMAFHSSAQPVFPRIQWTIGENATMRSVIHSFQNVLNDSTVPDRVNSPGCMYQEMRCKIFDSDQNGFEPTQNIINLAGNILQAVITDPDNGGAIRREEGDVQCKWYSKLVDGSHTHPDTDCLELTFTAEIPLYPTLYTTASINTVSSSLYFTTQSIDLYSASVNLSGDLVTDDGVYINTDSGVQLESSWNDQPYTKVFS